MTTIRQARMIQLIHALSIDDRETIILDILANDSLLERRIRMALEGWVVLDEMNATVLAWAREDLLAVLEKRAQAYGARG